MSREHAFGGGSTVSLNGGDEELRAVRVGTSIRHGEITGAGVTEGKVLILKLTAVDTLEMM